MVSIARALLLRASRSAWMERQFRRRRFAQLAVRRFMPGEDAESALAAAGEFANSGMGTVFTSLGEQVQNLREVTAVRDHYLELLASIEQRKLPAHISVKATHLGLRLDPALCAESVITLTRRASESGSFVWIDMEESQYVDETLNLYRAARATSDKVGVCLQSYLRRTPADVESLLPIAPSIRLVKGAYREPQEIAFPKKRDTDQAYLDLALRLLGAERRGLMAMGTHDLKLIEQIRARAGAAKQWEVHMLYGIKAADQRALAASGLPVRVLISYGTHWYPWYVRRLAERPANVWFVVRNLW
jgi:proline dehydrogenase